ncbi:hypothetical protein [Flammeovirga aprica]|uniref:Lipoprotein n=1 Tax=Flammeovirga aprica JL-4 TaxID=694437 RepID=A0A7X9P1V2_9BACT|nr:hypothetical protein [Flammeovirga aprica]NME68016.1 hypothetical protein [Flammeovirga aprica JL-4]
MKKILIILATITVLFSCTEEKTKKSGMDFEKLKLELNLTVEQTLKYDEIIKYFEEDRSSLLKDLEATGNNSKKEKNKLLQISYQYQEHVLENILNEEQKVIAHEFIKRYMPGVVDYSDELKAEVIETLALDSGQVEQYLAINNAFVKAFHDAHDKFHGNRQTASMYWNQFNDSRKSALKKLFSEEQYAQYIELTMKESYRGQFSSK